MTPRGRAHAPSEPKCAERRPACGRIPLGHHQLQAERAGDSMPQRRRRNPAAPPQAQPNAPAAPRDRLHSASIPPGAMVQKASLKTRYQISKLNSAALARQMSRGDRGDILFWSRSQVVADLNLTCDITMAESFTNHVALKYGMVKL